MLDFTRCRAEPNCPARKGQLASRKVLFGGYSRYAIAAIHTRFDAVEWLVWDAGTIDPSCPGSPAVIRQEATLEAAIEGLL